MEWPTSRCQPTEGNLDIVLSWGNATKPSLSNVSSANLSSGNGRSHAVCPPRGRHRHRRPPGNHRRRVTGFLPDAPTFASISAALERFWARRSEAEEIGKAAARRIRQLAPPDPIRVLSDKLRTIAEQAVSG